MDYGLWIEHGLWIDYTGQQNFFGIYGETVSGVYRGR